MRLDVEKKIDVRVVPAFDDIVSGPDAKTRHEILDGVRTLVGAVWAQKIAPLFDALRIPHITMMDTLNKKIYTCLAKT